MEIDLEKMARDQLDAITTEIRSNGLRNFGHWFQNNMSAEEELHRILALVIRHVYNNEDLAGVKAPALRQAIVTDIEDEVSMTIESIARDELKKLRIEK